MRQRSFRAIGLLAVTLLAIAGITWIGVENSSAKPSQRNVCVDKDTREMKIRKNCRDNENLLMEADVLIRGGKSAYETWIELGNKGTPAQFIASLQGSSSGSSYNPFKGVTCQAAVQHAETNMGRHIRYKDVWDFVEAQSGCNLGKSMQNTYFFDTDFNGTLKEFSLRVLPSPSITVTRTASRPATYLVPIELDITVELRNGWQVCDTSHPFYGNTSFATTSQFAHWAQIESFKVSANRYRITSTAYIYRFGILLATDSEETGGLDRLPVCRVNTSTTTGYELNADGLIYVPYASPASFRGLGIHYIAEWGWE